MQAVHLLLCIALVLCLLATQAVAATGGTQARPARVWLDSSHDFLFVIDHLGHWLGDNGHEMTLSRATLSTEKLRSQDALIIWQWYSPLAYSDDDLRTIRGFVERGGGLFLLGSQPDWKRGVVWNLSGKTAAEKGIPYQLNSVAALFGVEFIDKPAELPLKVEPSRLTDETREWPQPGKGIVGTLRLPKGAQPILVDAQGEPVAAALTVGKGRVFVTADVLMADHRENAGVKPVLLNAFAWLTEKRTGRGAPGERFLDIFLPADGGTISLPDVEITYPHGVEREARYMASQFARAKEVLQDFFGVPPLRKIRMEALAASGGGFTALDLIGIGALGEGPAWEKSVKHIVLWEMTNAWGLPEAENWTECWACLTETLLRARLDDVSGFGVETALYKLQDADSVRKLDPTLSRLDVSKPNSGEAWRPSRSKMALMFRELHAMYGDRFFSRLNRIHRARHHDELLSGKRYPIDDIVEEFSLAAGRDLFAWFASFGTEVTPRPVDLSKADEALAAYDRLNRK